ncbi:hypothetical protein [Qipengyuania sediminis]|uniref:hypothetical protein n=1 Tax=Qipengyuania sediminis TaxID=1532023 RepID=UPI0014052994|nr:hypothetical protein [Qipengyuania sediminis]
MRYGLLALSFAMLAGGGVAAQSALAITGAARAAPAYADAGSGKVPPLALAD